MDELTGIAVRCVKAEVEVVRSLTRGFVMRGLLSTCYAVPATWLLPGWTLAQERHPYGWDMHPMWWWGGAWGIGMMFMMVLFWGLVIVGTLLAIRWLAAQGKETRSDSALEILRQRYARGEIDKNEFEARRKDLL